MTGAVFRVPWRITTDTKDTWRIGLLTTVGTTVDAIVTDMMDERRAIGMMMTALIGTVMDEVAFSLQTTTGILIPTAIVRIHVAGSIAGISIPFLQLAEIATVAKAQSRQQLPTTV